MCLYCVDSFWIMNVCRDCSYHLGGIERDARRTCQVVSVVLIPHRLRVNNSTQVGCGSLFWSDFPGTEVRGPIEDDWMVSAPVTMMNAPLVSDLIP